MLLRISITILLMFLMEAKQISALRYAYDSGSNEVNLQFNGQRFLLNFQNSIQYEEVHFCFRQRPVVNNNQMEACNLGNQKGTYECLTINLSTNFGLYWQADNDLNASPSTTIFTFNYFLNSTTLIYSLDGKLNGNTTFSFLPQKNTVYEVVAVPQQYPPNRAYTHTFSVQDEVRTENILFQRQVICTPDGDINHLLFLGGVIRNSINIYMAAFLTYSRTKKPFSFWGGLSFSSDKASRDMLGVFPEQDNYADLYSLYAAPPYKDLSTNINGTQDWTQISSSFLATQSEQSWYYFTSLYRKYQTANPKGDQQIMMKIKNKYCFVSWTSQTISLVGIPQPYIEDYMHTTLNCFIPDIELYSKLQAFSLIFMILFILLL